MKNRKVFNIILSVVILGISLSVFIVVLHLFLNKSSPTPSNIPNNTVTRTSVVVAAQDIPSGTVITSSMLTTKNMPIENGIFVNPIQVVGSISSNNILKGEVIVQNEIIDNNKISIFSIASSIPPNEFAYPLQVSSQIEDNGGYIQEGDHVDLIINTNGAYSYAMTNITVLKVGTPVNNQTNGRGVVASNANPSELIILVNKQQALLLANINSKNSTSQIAEILVDPYSQWAIGTNSGSPSPSATPSSTTSSPSPIALPSSVPSLKPSTTKG